jgi:hypothetical protein
VAIALNKQQLTETTSPPKEVQPLSVDTRRRMDTFGGNINLLDSPELVRTPQLITEESGHARKVSLTFNLLDQEPDRRLSDPREIAKHGILASDVALEHI